LRSTTSRDSVEVIETEMTRLARTLAVLARHTEPEPKVDRAGYLLLRTLDRIGPASINTLAAAVGLDASTVTRQVATMKELGVVERKINPGDRRSCIISPTAEGVELMRTMCHQRRSNLSDVVGDWADDERSMLGRLLAKLNDSIVRATGCGESALGQTAG
jgi:DNA-binding MarR family transcriptional regulator